MNLIISSILLTGYDSSNKLVIVVGNTKNIFAKTQIAVEHLQFPMITGM